MVRGVKPKAKATSTPNEMKLNLLKKLQKCRIVTSLSLGMSVNDIAAAMKVAKPTISSDRRIFIQSSAFQSLYRLHNLTLLILLISVMNGFFVDQYDLKAPDSLLPSSVYIFQTVLNLSFIRCKNHGNRKPW